MPDNIYPDLSNSKFDIKYARLKALASDISSAQTFQPLRQSDTTDTEDTTGGSTVNEIVNFAGVTELTLDWTEERVTNFGAAGVFQVEIVSDDDQVRVTTVEIKPDNILATTSYHFDFGGVATGRIIIT